MDAFTQSTKNYHPTRLGVVNNPWGYSIRCKGVDRSMAIAWQIVAAVTGVALLIGAGGLWLMPDSLMSADVIGMKIALSTPMVLIATVMLWFALHGTRAEIHLDRDKRELRHILRSKHGRIKVLDRISFENIGSVYIDRFEPKKDKVRLLLRLGNLRQVIIVAIDREENLTALRDLMGNEILGHSSGHRPLSKRGFLFPEARGVVLPKLAAA